MNPANPHPGALIVVEGIDGAGSTTQSNMLLQWLQSVDIPATFTFEPSTGAIGTVVRRHLGRHVELGGPEAEALAFAADRMDHVVSEVVPALAGGTTVVTDRYYLSSLAYQALNCDPAWLREINRYALRPDLTVFPPFLWTWAWPGSAAGRPANASRKTALSWLRSLRCTRRPSRPSQPRAKSFTSSTARAQPRKSTPKSSAWRRRFWGRVIRAWIWAETPAGRGSGAGRVALNYPFAAASSLSSW
jgi:hypothetical protein